MAGHDGGLTQTFEMTPEDLAELLNEWRLRYGRKPTAKKEDIDDWV